MIFNPDLNKQGQEVIFSDLVEKLKEIASLLATLLFNNIPLSNSYFRYTLV